MLPVCVILSFSSFLSSIYSAYISDFHVQCTIYMYMCKCTYICWQLLSKQNFKGSYLEAEVVEEIMGWLG